MARRNRKQAKEFSKMVKDTKKQKRFNLKFSSEELQSGNRKSDSNYYKRKISSKKIAYIYSLIKNIDQLLIVASFTLPTIKTGLIDRFLILAMRFGVRPVIILTKSDLVDQETIDYFVDMYEGLTIPVLVVSNETLEGLDEVKKLLANRTTAIIGHSGVGKTTMLNHLDPQYQERTQDISDFTKRGRHTTTRILLHTLSFGGTVYDMPGLKEMDFIDIASQNLKHYYLEFEQSLNELQISCQFKNCSHTHEPNCEVKNLLESGEIHPERYQNYLKILADLEEAEQG